MVGKPIRNWLHACDTAEAVLTIINSNVKNEIYNICGGFEQSNLDTVKQIIKSYHNIDPTSEEINTYLDLSYSRQGQDVRYALNDDKLRKLGWYPKIVFAEELPKIVNSLKEDFVW